MFSGEGGFLFLFFGVFFCDLFFYDAEMKSPPRVATDRPRHLCSALVVFPS